MADDDLRMKSEHSSPSGQKGGEQKGLSTPRCCGQHQITGQVLYGISAALGKEPQTGSTGVLTAEEDGSSPLVPTSTKK